MSENTIPQTFSWPHWGSHVQLAGTFDPPHQQWVPIDMKKDGDSSEFKVTLNLMPEKNYLYKFVVDGNWVLNHEHPSHPDDHGNMNHVVSVELPSQPESPLLNEPKSLTTTYVQETEESKDINDLNEQEQELLNEGTLVEEQCIFEEQAIKKEPSVEESNVIEEEVKEFPVKQEIIVGEMPINKEEIIVDEISIKKETVVEDEGVFFEETVGDIEDQNKFREMIAVEETTDEKTVEDIEEQDKTVEDIGEQDKAVEEIGEQDKSVEDIGEQDKSVEDIGEQDKTVVDIGEQDKTVDDIGEQEKTLQDVAKALENIGEKEKILENIEEQEKILEEIREHDTTVEDIREHDTTVEDIGEHDITVEDIGEHDETVEDIGEHDTAVEDIGEHDTAVEDIGEHDTTVEDIGEHDTAVEDIGEHDITVDDIGEHDTTVEDIGEHDITVEDIGEHDKTVEDIEKQDKTVEDIGEQDKSREMVFVEEEDEEKSRDTVFVEEEKETTVEETVKDIWEQDKSPEMIFSEVEKEITVGETVEESRDIFEEATVRETVEEQLKSREIVFVEETEVTVKETVEYTEEQEESEDISHTIDTEESVVRPSNIIEEVAFSTDKESSDNVKIESHFDDSSRDAVMAEQLESESLEPFASENLQAEDSLKNTETDSYNEKTMLHDDYTGEFNIAENASHDKKILNDETVESLNITYTTSEQNINVITRNVSESLETLQTEKDSETKAGECLGNTEAETEIMQTECSLKEDETENQAIPTEEPLENVKAEVEIIRTEEPLEDIKTETEKSLNVEIETEIIQTKESSEIETEIEIRGGEVETLQTQESMEHVENKVEREFLEENKNETGMMKNESLEFENNEIEFINNSELENLQTQNSLEFDDWAVDSYDPSENVGTVNLQTQEYLKSAEIETLQDNDSWNIELEASQTNEEIVDSSSLSTEEIEVTPETIVKETIDQVSQNEETLSHEHLHLDTNKSVNYIIADEEKVEFIETVSPSQHYSTGSEEIISEDENQGVYKSQVEISDVEDAENNGGLISSRVTYESEGLVTEEAIEDDERTIVEEMVNEAFTINDGDTGPIEDYGVLRSNSYIPKPNEFYPLDKMTAGYDLPENLFEDLGSSATACGDSLSVKSTFPNTNTTIVYNTTIDFLNTEKVNLDKTVVSSILKDEKNEETVHINSTDVSAARRRSNTVSSSSGESTKNANSKSTTRNISQELVIKPKTKVFDKHSETLSQEIVTVNKSRSLELRRDEVKAEGGLIYLVTSLVTTFTLGLISLFFKTIFGTTKKPTFAN